MASRQLAALALCAALAACGASDVDAPLEFERPETAVEYEATLTGAPTDETAALMRESLEVFRREGDGAQSVAFLRRRARSDLDTVREILRSVGYYEGDASVTVETWTPPPEAPEAPQRRTTGWNRVDTEPPPEPAAPPEPETPRYVVTVAVEPGPLYTLTGHRLSITPGGDRGVPEFDAVSFGSPVGSGAVASEILAAEQGAVRALRRDGRPYAETTGRTAIGDRDANTIEVDTAIAAGPYATYGDVRFEGLEDVDPDYLQSYVPWEPGAPVDTAQLRDFQRDLVGTDLFDAISARPPQEAPEGDGPVPITVTATEGPPRTVTAGVRWSTDVGPSTRLTFRHRNLFGANETLDLLLDAGLEEQSFEARYRVPQWLRDGQDFTSAFNARHTDVDAYEETAATLTAGVERELDDVWTVGAGGLAEVSETKDNQGRRTFYLFGLPVFVEHDNRDDILNPTEGVFARVDATPFSGVTDDGDNPQFTRLVGAASTYVAFDEAGRYVLAGRARVGTILADRLEDVPAGRRLYSGGGGSVRGFGEREIGPLDDDGDPTGGLSLLELGTELRAQVYGPLGFAAFVEGGAVGKDPTPTFSEDFLVAAGLGLRYYSPVGPIRLDVGVPVNPRDRDDDFQIYLSIGQAY